MHRFYLPPEQCQSSQLQLTKREAHHAVHVLRIQAGERVVVLDGIGHEFDCVVEQASHETVLLQVRKTNSTPRSPWAITLLQAIPKARLMEDIIQKATELGVHRIVPLLTERVVVHLDREGAEVKAAKWRQVAVEAIKQCGNAWLPVIDAPVSMKDFMARGETFDLSLIAVLAGEREHPASVLRDFKRRDHRQPADIGVWIGPEGDFAPDELALALSAGARPITLGRLVLRVETAATFCLSALNYEMESPA